jgi:hypothetical protein
LKKKIYKKACLVLGNSFLSKFQYKEAMLQFENGLIDRPLNQKLQEARSELLDNFGFNFFFFLNFFCC